MTYASEKSRSSFAGMSAAILVNGSIILAVALSPLVVEPRLPRPIMIGSNIPYKPAPQPPESATEAKPITPIFVPKPLFETFEPPIDALETTNIEHDIRPVIDGKGGDEVTETIREAIKLPEPIFKAAVRDPRFAHSFQPNYPVGMLQREIEGSVTVRVLVGVDGRVLQVAVLNATTPEFARATERQAKSEWRFKPAMRGSDAVEDWLTLTVRFDIN